MSRAAAHAALALGILLAGLAVGWVGAGALLVADTLGKDRSFQAMFWSLAQMGFVFVLGPPLLAFWLGLHAIGAARAPQPPDPDDAARTGPRPFDVAAAMLMVVGAGVLAATAAGPVQEALVRGLEGDIPTAPVVKAVVGHLLLIAGFMVLAGLWTLLRGALPRRPRSPGRSFGNIAAGLLGLLGLLWSALTGLCAFNPQMVGVDLWVLAVLLLAPGLAAVSAGWALWSRFG